ncbi:glycoside hydrolase family 5 protein [Aquimarina algicola]|uniref:Glycoside hydrolase family 5 protein n=1 Tax=Aquimarina algicola TaxID=2589995 RepID=A0A504J5H0_9FLAO|nr:glycoside hydrolase family 5 protein [Aquimarina algicola]TPN82853.1 glycoside hydrolase family 5 protein [Aquimarina algicola]
MFWSNANDVTDFYTKESVNALVDNWNSSIIRIAMGVKESWDGGRGYIDSPNQQEAKVNAVVDAAVNKGVYVIIDFHTHEAEKYTTEATKFFEKMAKAHGKKANVIFEIYNEPIGQSWSTIKNYAKPVINAIRKNSDNLIVVGTPFYSQNVDEAANDPISEKNIAYTLHFYAGTHNDNLRDKAKTALDKGIALFVTEWGATNADGNGNANQAETNKWMKFIKDNKLSHANWSVSDKNEGSSIVQSGQGINGLETNKLTPTGEFVKEIIKKW